MSFGVKTESVATSCFGHLHCSGRYGVCDQLRTQTSQISSLHKAFEDAKALFAQVYGWMVRQSGKHVPVVVLSLVFRNNKII